MTKLFNKKSLTKQRQYLRKQMPPAERKLWVKLKGRQLKGFRFRRQSSIGPYIVDFFCPKTNLAIELDGDSHFISQDKIVEDRQRQEYIESCGIRVLRFTNEDVSIRIEGVLDAILKELERLEEK